MLFRTRLNQAAIDDIRLALKLNQNQPLRDNRFAANIAQATGERREAQPRGRPRKVVNVFEGSTGDAGRQLKIVL